MKVSPRVPTAHGMMRFLHGTSWPFSNGDINGTTLSLKCDRIGQASVLPLRFMGRASSGSLGVWMCSCVFSAVMGIRSHNVESAFRTSLKLSENPGSLISLIIGEKALGSSSQSSIGNITLSSSGLV